MVLLQGVVESSKSVWWVEFANLMVRTPIVEAGGVWLDLGPAPGGVGQVMALSGF